MNHFKSTTHARAKYLLVGLIIILLGSNLLECKTATHEPFFCWRPHYYSVGKICRNVRLPHMSQFFVGHISCIPPVTSQFELNLHYSRMMNTPSLFVEAGSASDNNYVEDCHTRILMQSKDWHWGIKNFVLSY